MARSAVARQLVKLGGRPEYRQGVVTDNGNVILDVHTLVSPCFRIYRETLSRFRAPLLAW